MLPRIGKVFLVRLSWQRLFKGQTMLLTNTMAGGIISFVGAAVQQNWQNYKTPGSTINRRRLGNMFVIGCTYGPPLHYWYLMLDRVFMGRTFKVVCKKILLDQAIGTTLCVLWFFVGMALLEGHRLSKGWNEFKEKFCELFLVECCFWIPAQALNFFFVKPKYRVVFIFSATLVWDIYLSYIKFRDEDPRTEPVSDSSAEDVQQEALPPSKPLEEKT